MALEKIKVLENGSTGKYWRILNLIIDKSSMKVSWGLALFEDKAHSDAKYPFLLIKQFGKVCSKAEMQGDLSSVGYAFIKTEANKILKPAPGDSGIVYKYPDLANALDV